MLFNPMYKLTLIHIFGMCVGYKNECEVQSPKSCSFPQRMIVFTHCYKITTFGHHRITSINNVFQSPTHCKRGTIDKMASPNMVRSPYRWDMIICYTLLFLTRNNGAFPTQFVHTHNVGRKQQ